MRTIVKKRLPKNDSKLASFYLIWKIINIFVQFMNWQILVYLILFCMKTFDFLVIRFWIGFHTKRFLDMFGIFFILWFKRLTFIIMLRCDCVCFLNLNPTWDTNIHPLSKKILVIDDGIKGCLQLQNGGWGTIIDYSFECSQPIVIHLIL